jgi:hypothetical protein
MDQAVSTILPRFAVADAGLWVAWFAAVAWLPGLTIVRLAGWRAAYGYERWTLTAVVGILWASWTYYLLSLIGGQPWHLVLAVVPAVGDLGVRLVLWLRGRSGLVQPVAAPSRTSDRWFEILGLVLVAGFAVHYVVRVSAAIVPDASGVRLYGALYSDKLTNMSPCAALMRGVPPANLRMSGQVFPYHYFPHLLVAAASRATGVDYTSGFWFYAAVLGIAINGLAVLAFSRHALGSPGLGLVGLVYFGLTQFGPETRPLDLSIAMLLLGLVGLDRFRREGRRRWAALAVVLFASMPLYEAFHAQALLGGLAVWWLAGAVARIRKRIGDEELLFRTAVAGTTLLAALGATRALTLGAKVVSPAKVVFKNSYRESYRNEWLNAVRDAGDRPNWARTLLRWKRAKDPGPAGESELPAELRPSMLQRIAGEVVYDGGFVIYVVLRFLNAGVLGLVALLLAWRAQPAGWRTTEAIVACVAVVGFVLPAVVTWGHLDDGRWWETPNLYRFTHGAYLLLLVLGPGAFVAGRIPWRRVRWWPVLGLAAWQLYALAVAALQTPDSFHHVSTDRLAALEYLRREVPADEIVIHPWIDDLIRDRHAADRIAWTYKRHFTLGSNLAGQQMYYEGREDHLFIGGFIAPEEVAVRRRLRLKFYEAPDAATLREVLDQAGVTWVVADADHPAPSEVRQQWHLEFQRGPVRVYHTRPRRPPHVVYPALPRFPDDLVPAP